MNMGNGISAESVQLITDYGRYVRGHFNDRTLRDSAFVASYNRRTWNKWVQQITFRAWNSVSQCLAQQKKTVISIPLLGCMFKRIFSY